MNRKSGLLIALATAWDLGWKAAATFKAVQRRDFKWVPLLVSVNSVGLLPMVYLFFVAKDDEEDEELPIGT